MYKLQYSLAYVGLRDCFRYRLILMVLSQILTQVSEIGVEDLAICFEKHWLSTPDGHVFDECEDYRGFNCYEERDIYQLFGLELIPVLDDDDYNSWL